MVPADSFPEGWPCCDPSFVLETLHELEKEECPQEKKFYSTYAMKWEKLDMEKRQKTFVFFSKLDSSVKMTISAKATEKEKLSLSAARTENNGRHYEIIQEENDEDDDEMDIKVKRTISVSPHYHS